MILHYSITMCVGIFSIAACVGIRVDKIALVDWRYGGGRCEARDNTLLRLDMQVGTNRRPSSGLPAGASLFHRGELHAARAQPSPVMTLGVRGTLIGWLCLRLAVPSSSQSQNDT